MCVFIPEDRWLKTVLSQEWFINNNFSGTSEHLHNLFTVTGLVVALDQPDNPTFTTNVQRRITTPFSYCIKSLKSL